MKFRLKEASAVLLALFVITACDSDYDDTGEVTDPMTAAAYIGNWTTGCVVSPYPPAAVDSYFTFDLQLDATTWQFVTSGYLDESCTIQSQETADVTSVRGTTTITGTFTDSGEVTTTDGLQANNLTMTVDTFTNTLDELGDPPNEAIGTTNDALVHVDAANVLFLDDALLGINEAPGTLVLTMPFDSIPQ